MAEAEPIRTMDIERLAMRFAEPFRISGYEFTGMPSVLATIRDGRIVGRGEAAGVYYLGDDQDKMVRDLEAAAPAVATGIGREELRRAMPACGARNAIDCALWEVESRRSDTPVAELAGIGPTTARITTFTLPADAPEVLERKLPHIAFARAIKLKFDGEFEADRARLDVIRRSRPDVWIGVDANQGYTAQDLDRLERLLVEQRVGLIEQPLPRGDENPLKDWRPGVPVAADESILDLAELEERGTAFDVINIKLDKCGGLTEALAMARVALDMGKKLMVGNMGGSALAMAPAFVVAQLCEVVDLDGPWGLADRADAERLYRDGLINVPPGLWGA